MSLSPRATSVPSLRLRILESVRATFLSSVPTTYSWRHQKGSGSEALMPVHPLLPHGLDFMPATSDAVVRLERRAATLDREQGAAIGVAQREGWPVSEGDFQVGLTRIIRRRIIRLRMNEMETLPIVPALERAAHAVALWIERTFPDLRLTQAEAHVLAYLADHAPCSINDLHHSFGHRRSTLTSLLDRLERRGWVRRGAHPSSRRLVLVELTDAGRPVAERVRAAIRELEQRVATHAGSQDVAAFRQVIQILEEELQ